jgi:hypothetical protein
VYSVTITRETEDVDPIEEGTPLPANSAGRSFAPGVVVLNVLFVLWRPPRAAKLLWHSGRLSTGLIAAVLLAAPVAASAPRRWRGLALLFAGSAV